MEDDQKILRCAAWSVNKNDRPWRKVRIYPDIGYN